MERDCEHGQLARSCNICDLERDLKLVTEQRDKLLAALEKCRDMVGHPDNIAFIDAAIADVKGQS
jgi:hypothetical protein